MKFDRRISRRSFLAAAGVTSAALALTACGGSSSSVAASSASGTASSAAGTAQGGTLNIMLETEVQSLDPQVATDGISCLSNLFSVVFIAVRIIAAAFRSPSQLPKRNRACSCNIQ